MIELIDEDLHVAGQVLDAGDQVVVAKQRRDRDAEAGNGGDQRGRDAGRDRIDVDVAACRDRGKGDHDADHGAEQAEKRSARDRDRQHHHHAVEALGLAHIAAVEHRADRLRSTAARARDSLPFPAKRLRISWAPRAKDR